jgi:hypothetical protein
MELRDDRKDGGKGDAKYSCISIRVYSSIITQVQKTKSTGFNDEFYLGMSRFRHNGTDFYLIVAMAV